MATVWSDLSKLGPGWVIPIVTAGFTTLVLVFGYIFESTYYGVFGIEITDHASRTYFLFSPFRQPVTFAWAVLFTVIFTLNFRIALGIDSYKQALYQVLFLVAMVYGSYLYITGDAKEQAEALRPINIPSVDSDGTLKTFLLVGNIGTAFVVCDPDSWRVKIIAPPNLIEFPDASEGKVNAVPCWQSEVK